MRVALERPASQSKRSGLWTHRLSVDERLVEEQAEATLSPTLLRQGMCTEADDPVTKAG
ncbi:hypothetical protein J3A66_002077 [Sphingomonas sp. PvP018]|nr:hypothetical protein [Sphingomonas sp. PvP018]